MVLPVPRARSSPAMWRLATIFSQMRASFEAAPCAGEDLVSQLRACPLDEGTVVVVIARQLLGIAPVSNSISIASVMIAIL